MKKLKRDKVYLYPLKRTQQNNPFNKEIAAELKALGAFVVNEGQRSSHFINAFKYYLKANIFVFSWPENVAENKFGSIQTALLVVLFFLLKFSGKKIVWFNHNAIAHRKNNWQKKLFIYLMFAVYSDKTISLTKDAQKFVTRLNRRENNTLLRHPLFSISQLKSTMVKTWDILIWGDLFKYKGVEELVFELGELSISSELKILIIGKDKENLHPKISLFKDNFKELLLINERPEDKQLSNLIDSTEFVFFSNNSPSVFASGVLLFNLSKKANVIAPFTELTAEYSDYINVYSNRVELEKIIQMKVNKLSESSLNEYDKKNSWKTIASEILK